jgi:hypothetical protein
MLPTDQRQDLKNLLEDELNCPVCRCNFTLNEEGKSTTLYI